VGHVDFLAEHHRFPVGLIIVTFDQARSLPELTACGFSCGSSDTVKLSFRVSPLFSETLIEAPMLPIALSGPCQPIVRV